MDKNNQTKEAIHDDAYKAAIERMLKNIHDGKRLYRIYKYILYVYTHE